MINRSEEEGNDREPIRPSTTPDQGHRMKSDKNTAKRLIQKNQEVNQQVTTWLQDTDKTIWQREI